MIVMGEQETVEARDVPAGVETAESVAAERAAAEREAAVRRLGGLRRALADVGTFSETALRMPLRPYQLDVARAVARSVAERQGLTFTVLMPRQSGKNQLSAHLEAFLLVRRQRVGVGMVKCGPTFRPQSLTSIARLARALDGNLTRGRWRRRDGYTIELGRASIAFFSAGPGANVVGATASLLLECDEAQDVDADVWEKSFRPMGATANATAVLYGTPWTDDTLLARQIAMNREAEARDGVRRHFQVDWSEVARANPDYGRYVRAEIARLGEHHPIVRTQYLLRTVAGGGRFLDATQLALLDGEHPPESRPADAARGAAGSHAAGGYPTGGTMDGYATAGQATGGYVAGIDVAGADEEDPDGLAVRVNVRRDSTVLTIARVEEARVADLVVEPRLRVVRQYAWRGTPHRQLYPTILELVRGHRRCRRVVVDATGVGGGLAAFLGAALGPGTVVPYVYTAARASEKQLRNKPDARPHGRFT